MTSHPHATILVPTRGRPSYLDVALESIAHQARDANAELVVVSDGGGAQTAALAAGHGARLIELPGRSGLNAARNAGIAATTGDPVVMVDDDVRAPAGWLAEMLAGIERAPDREVFGGPIRAVLEGGGPRSCGREGSPITSLDLGPEDRDVAFVWGANLTIRRRALAQVGPFDESLGGRGDEEDWERRHIALGGRIRYVGRAGLEHRRTRRDASLRRLSRAEYSLGRAARRYDVHKLTTPTAARELRTLLGSIWHVARRRCALGIVTVAHSAGRVSETIARHGR